MSEVGFEPTEVDCGIKKIVRSGIRTHAYKSRLRPERSALDHSAILTYISTAHKDEHLCRGREMETLIHPTLYTLYDVLYPKGTFLFISY